MSSEIDDKNIHHARQNIHLNNLSSRIKPIHTKPTDALIPLDQLGIESISFTLTNPPFYPSTSSLLLSAQQKSRPPYSACTGAPVEMVTPGGETAFVSRIIAESAVLKARCQWYTTLLGKLSSVGTVVEELRAKGVANWAVKEFVQGGRTRRWGVGWSWGARRPMEGVARGVGSGGGVERRWLPGKAEMLFEVKGLGVGEVARRVCGVLEGLDEVRWEFRRDGAVGVGFTPGDVWSRAARRKKERDEGAGGKETGEVDQKEPALGFKIQLTVGEDGGTFVRVRWLVGRENVLFESFCGMLKRRVS
ncbi:MAG: hypothetical protein Q9219_000746 [cf. Caloplaca sp. 3 TL-2023]